MLCSVSPGRAKQGTNSWVAAKKIPARQFKSFVLEMEDVYGGQAVEQLGKIDREQREQKAD